MQNKKYDLKVITDYLYTNGVNMSGRKKTYPKDNDKLIEPYEIDRINIGGDGLNGSFYTRTSFKGSETWYTVPIKNGNEDEWWRILKYILKELSSTEDKLFDDILLVENKEGEIW